MYKVMIRMDGLYSAWIGKIYQDQKLHDPEVSARMGALMVEYIPGEWVYPKIGKLLVFNSEKSAREWSSYHVPEGEIWKCEVINPVRCRSLASVWFLSERDSFFEALQKSWETFATNTDSPTGTMQCDAVKLVKRI